ncbi:Conserved_hypothetical protein [Hexamita inflata]|uniref:HECT domain-containing protein n=1 Tax=Hexamita inflata TaxID=28002 RepID=A0AA86NWV0_9EUKA|nr:Conserved hypothetical protein [Hexamita inflata]
MLPTIQQQCQVIEKEPVTQQNSFATSPDIIAEDILGMMISQQQLALQHVQTLLDEYTSNVIPDRFNDLLLAVTTSQEVYDIFSSTIKYFQNLLMLKDMLQNQKKSSGETITLEQIAIYANNLDFDQLQQRFKDAKIKYSSSSNQKLSRFLELLTSIQNKSSFKFVAGTKGDLLFATKTKDCDINFDHLQPMFKYQDDLVQTLSHVIRRDEANPEDQIQIQHFVENNKSELDMTEEQGLRQTPREFFLRVLQRQNIKVQQEVIYLKALIMKAIGVDVVDSVSILTPSQLSCCFVQQTDFQLPHTVTPFFLNKQLYYQCKFDLTGFVPLYQQTVKDDFMLNLTSQLIVFNKYYNSTTHRLLLFPNFNCTNIYIQEKTVNDKATYTFKFLGVPTNLFQFGAEKMFIYQNMKLEYCYQYMIVDITAQCLILSDQLSNHVDHFTKLAHTIGEDLVHIKYMQTVLQPKDYLRYLLVKCQQSAHFLYFCVTKHNVMSEMILSIFTILKSGFLRLQHSSFTKFVSFQMNYYEFIHYDRQTVWQVLLQHVQAYYKKPENDSQVLITHRDQKIRQYLTSQMPIIGSFFEDEQLSFNQDQDYKPLASSAITNDVDEVNAKNCLIALVHELQHIPRHGYASEIDTAVSFLPQILADSTSISPLCSSIRFHYKEQQGIDAGGMWRQTLSMMFNDLLGEAEISNEVLQKIKDAGKFGKRDLKFTELNKGNPNSPSLLKAINFNTHTILVPHYNGYVCRTSSSVYPRLTDKRSCLYYFGRIVAFCLIYSGKMPNFLHENFWKALVGGRLYFDEEVTEKYKEQMERDQMFKINGTKPLSQLYYELTEQEAETFYKPYTEIWKMAQQPNMEVDFLGLHAETLNEIQQGSVQLTNPAHLKRYAQKAVAEMKSGAAFAKSYSEFRNGFRHPFATSMATPINQPELLEMARMIDKCLEVITFKDLEAILTFDPHNEEYVNRQTIVENLFRRNVQRIQMEIDESNLMLICLEHIVSSYMDKDSFSHKQLLDMVYACTGARTLAGTEITVSFVKAGPQDIVQGKPVKRYIQFHTCFNQMDVPLLYVSTLKSDELAIYLEECVNLALQNGFAMM